MQDDIDDELYDDDFDDDLRCSGWDFDENDEDACSVVDDTEPPAPVVLAPTKKLPGKGILVRTYNRLGGIMEQLGAENDIDVAAILAFWRVECGPFVHVPGQAIIRFENHRLFKLWGKAHPAEFKAHYRFAAKKQWLEHQFRVEAEGPFVPSHVKQTVEYAALAKATELAGEDIALRCISIGGPQILLSNHLICGYQTPKEMYDAFQGTEDTHVRGFLEFCKSKNIVDAMRDEDWEAAAKVYNGMGQWKIYGAKIRAAYAEAKKLLASL